MTKTKAFTQHRDNGFYLSFPNGNGLSTVWGRATYSDNYNVEVGMSEVIPKGSNTVEVMPHCSGAVKKLLDAAFPEEENGSVFGYMTFEKWLKMVNILNENN